MESLLPFTPAREKAAAAGFEAEAVARHGRPQAELAAAGRELGATIVVLGRPREGGPVFDKDELEPFAGRLRAEIGWRCAFCRMSGRLRTLRLRSAAGCGRSPNDSGS